ncbi:unannotated protein [freshwater metagenome]|uniref:Unannotated protein n=1 Tax=freshwater metagenome TaxID=449393 RepID=A0A6J7XVI7_9ZZZZ
MILRSDEITLAPLRLRDRKKWFEVRAHNRAWLAPWEATLPRIPSNSGQEESPLPSYFEMIRVLNREGREGRSISLVMWHGDQLIGQITMGGIIYGALRGAHIGYWIDQRYAGRGFTTQAVKLITAYGFSHLSLHRLEINLRPENEASRKVAQKAGYHLEGEKPRYLHIDGIWRDHICFVKENPAVI